VRFVPELVELPGLSEPRALPEGTWTILAAAEDPCVRTIEHALRATGASGTAVLLPRDGQFTDISLLLATAVSLLRRSPVLRSLRPAEAPRPSSAASIAELPELRTCVIHCPGRTPDGLPREVASAAPGYREVHYHGSGIRRRAFLTVLPLDEPDGFRLTASDVIGVTGGGKGMTAECALALARESGARLLLLGRFRSLRAAAQAKSRTYPGLGRRRVL